MSKDKDYIRLINCSRWLRLRRAVLTRQPLCDRCQQRGYVVAASEVHHRVPVESATSLADKERLMYNPDNLRPLCHRCHVEVHRELFKCSRTGAKERTRQVLDDFNRRYYGENDCEAR